MNRKRSRCDISPSEKKAICLFKVQHPKVSQEEIAVKLGSKSSLRLGTSAIGDIIGQKDKWLNVDETISAAKRSRAPKHADLDQALRSFKPKQRSSVKNCR